MQIKTQQYRVRDGFQLPAYSAEIIADAVANGAITAEALKERARPEDNPLHGFIFDLAPNDAAEEYYTQRAGYCLRAVEVVVTNGQETGAIPLVSYIQVEAQEDDGDERRRMPVTASDAMRDPAMLELLEQQARRDLRAFRRKYEALKAIASWRPVFEAVQNL